MESSTKSDASSDSDKETKLDSSNSSDTAAPAEPPLDEEEIKKAEEHKDKGNHFFKSKSYLILIY